jgi:hypothetical protein
VAVPRLASSLTPWKEWQTDQNPPWWQSYNNVKHRRDTHYAEANLGNVLLRLRALRSYLLFYQEAFQAHKIDPVR